MDRVDEGLKADIMHWAAVYVRRISSFLDFLPSFLDFGDQVLTSSSIDRKTACD